MTCSPDCCPKPRSSSRDPALPLVARSGIAQVRTIILWKLASPANPTAGACRGGLAVVADRLAFGVLGCRSGRPRGGIGGREVGRMRISDVSLLQVPTPWDGDARGWTTTATSARRTTARSRGRVRTVRGAGHRWTGSDAIGGLRGTSLRAACREQHTSGPTSRLSPRRSRHDDRRPAARWRRREQQHPPCLRSSHLLVVSWAQWDT